MAVVEFFGNCAQDAGMYWSNAQNPIYNHRVNTTDYGVPWGVPNSSSIFHQLATPKSHVFIGWAARCDAWAGTHWVQLNSIEAVNMSVGITNNFLNLYRGGWNTTLISSTPIPGTLVNGQWYYFEIEVTFSDTGGIFKMRIDQVELINYVGDTKAGGTASTFASLSFGQNGNWSTHICDYYVCDDTGPAPRNTFLGDVRITRHRPTAPGASTQFTPDSGANWSRVNESPWSAANYVASSTSGHVDSYALNDLPPTAATVLAVKSTVLAKNPDGGLAQIKNLIRTGGTNYLGAATNLGSSDNPASTVWEQNPNTTANWTPAEVNALESGFQRV